MPTTVCKLYERDLVQFLLTYLLNRSTISLKIHLRFVSVKPYALHDISLLDYVHCFTAFGVALSTYRQIMNTNLSGRRAVVCGSTQGIGRAIAIELATLGADVSLMARSPERLESVSRELDTNSGQKHEMIVADFSEPAQVKMAIDQFVAAKKTADILINNTGGPPAGLAIDAKANDFLKAFNSHLICNQLMAQALVPGMKKREYGRIINVISTSVKQPIQGLGVSNTIRGAVASWSKTLANELGQFGITVNNILPGPTKTGRMEQIIQARSKSSGETPEEVTREFESRVPLGRFAHPSEIATVAAFLATPAASYVNGINVPVDGGQTASL